MTKYYSSRDRSFVQTMLNAIGMRLEKSLRLKNTFILVKYSLLQSPCTFHCTLCPSCAATCAATTYNVTHSPFGAEFFQFNFPHMRHVYRKFKFLRIKYNKTDDVFPHVLSWL